jgi:hypothetical protein
MTLRAWSVARAAAGLVAAGLVAAGCGGGGAKSDRPSQPGRAEPPSAPSTGLNALALESEGLRLGSEVDLDRPLTEADKSALAELAALDLESLLAKRPGATTSTPEPAGDAWGSSPGAGLTALAPEAAGAAGTTSAAPASTQPVASAPAPVVRREADESVLRAAAEAWATPAPGAGRVTPAGTGGAAALAARGPDDTLLDMARKMAALLREPTGRIDDAVALAAVESLRPGVLASMDDPANVLRSRLDAADLATLLEARGRVASGLSEGMASLTRALAGIAPAPGLRVTRGALCRRVQGFGRYEAFATTRFVAGAPIRAIVYTEIEGFGYRAAREGDPALKDVPLSEQVSVELTQELGLFQEPGGLRVWHRPAQRVIETTRGKRRDFYLIHTIDLPPTLGVGSYVLKAIVTDATTGSGDEVNIPITVVAR